MNYLDTPDHTRGASLFVDDLPVTTDCLYAALFVSPIPHGRIQKLHISNAQKCDGVVKILTAKDIPGENQIGNIILDEQLFAEEFLYFVGQPVALVVAVTDKQARYAVTQIQMEVEKIPTVFDARKAAEKGQLIAPSRTLCIGDMDSVWSRCTTVVKGTVESGGQEHVYLEPQSVVVFPEEKQGLKIISSTQSPTTVQRITARVLGLPMNKIEVEVRRIGGAFGGKEEQATSYAVMAALAASKIQRPVKLILNHDEDMRLTGKRHPYSADFKIGIDSDKKIIGYEVTYYQNAGAAADLSTSILERTLLHSTNTYFIPNVRVTGLSCRTNCVPNTAFRGFGAPQAMFVMESAICKIAEISGVPVWEIQQHNLLSEGDAFPYGAKAQNCHALRSFEAAIDQFHFDEVTQKIETYNSLNHTSKRGYAIMPICYGISFTSKFLNQAGALLHIYIDGSVSVSTGAVEMGQGVFTKVRKIVAQTLSIPEDRIIINSTNTRTVANTSPTAASTATDLNGMAARFAALAVLDRLKGVAASILSCEKVDLKITDGNVFCKGLKTDLTWSILVNKSYFSRVNLSAQAFYATPHIYYDKAIEKGQPFSYYVYGAAIIEVTLDCLRGTYTIDSVRIVHDAGKSLAPLVDQGQVEGAVVQGIGWMTIEELLYGENGCLLTDSLMTYKVPDIHFAPRELEVVFLDNADNPNAVLQTKGIGEPPFMYGIGAYFAIMQAMKAYKKDKPAFFRAPLTHEKVLMFLHGQQR